MRDWVDCPICHETDMCREIDDDGNALIYYVNHSCPSNDVDYVEPSATPYIQNTWQQTLAGCIGAAIVIIAVGAGLSLLMRGYI